MNDLSTATRRPPIDTVRKWTIAVGVLTSGNMSRADAELKLAAYVPLLQDHFPAGAFTQASLHHVARQCKWFPSYAEVCEHLGAWWKEHRPPMVALPPPDDRPLPERPPPTPEEAAAVHARVQEVIAAIHSPASERPAVREPTPRYLTPAQLDALNPLPDGRRRAS